MAFSRPHPGLVIRYGYLWHDEHVHGQEEAAKDRPCVVVLATHTTGEKTLVTVAPVTHTAPLDVAHAVEIPLPTKQRLGLDDARSWVVVNEVNCFEWPGPDLRPMHDRAGDIAYGVLPSGVFQQITHRLLALAQAQRSKTVVRVH